jgi:hypothetical protein
MAHSSPVLGIEDALDLIADRDHCLDIGELRQAI